MARNSNWPLLALGLFSCVGTTGPAPGSTVPRPPVRFEENAGQLDPEVRFVRRTPGGALFLMDRKVVVVSEGLNLDLEFPGTASPRPVGLQELPGRSHHFRGSDPARWVRDVRGFGRVLYPSIYPGIDLLFREGPEARVEFDLVVRPGGRPDDVRIRAGATARARIDRSGDLVLGTGAGAVRLGAPETYQELLGARSAVAARFVRLGRREFGIRVGRHDAGRPLVIDPVLTFSTYFGGTRSEEGYALAVGPTGNIYVAGTTYSGDLPVANAFQPLNNSPSYRDAFVSAFDPTGQRLVFSTFLGGRGSYEMAHGLAVDGSGNVYVAGETHSLDFPVTPKAYQTKANIYAGSDGFVSKIAPDGRSLVFSTYLAALGSGVSFERCYAVAVGRDGAVTVGGETSTPSWPVTPGAFDTDGCGQNDAFVTRLRPDGGGLVFSTYLCGAGGLDAVEALQVEADGSTLAAGRTSSGDFPVAGPVGSAFAGSVDAFLAKLVPTGSSLAFSRLLGGSGNDQALGLATDAAGRLWIAGKTRSPDFPVRNAYQPVFGGGGATCEGEVCPDAFLARLSASGELEVSTYLGGIREDVASSVAVSHRGRVAITGWTGSDRFPTRDAIQPVFQGGRFDAFAATFDPSGALVFSTFLGGSDDDQAHGAGFDQGGALAVAGSSYSGNFPTADPFQPAKLPGDNTDVFVSRIAFEDSTAGVFVPIVLSAAGKQGSFFTSELALSNRGSTAVPLTFTYTPAPGLGGGAGSVTDTLPAGQQKVVPEALAYLKGLGLGIEPTGDRGGTLRVTIPGTVDPTAVAVTVRTTTPAAGGRAGLAYTGVPEGAGLTGAAILAGLRQNEQDRSNVALQNLGRAEDGEVTLRLTVISGDPSAPLAHALPPLTLAPGGFVQVSEVLRADSLALTNGFVRVERVSGSAPYYAYGVVNDQANSDGSFVPPVLEFALQGVSGLTVPVVVETSAFASELVVTNTTSSPRRLRALWVAEGLTTPDSTVGYELVIGPLEQRIIPDFVQAMRGAGTPGMPPRGVNLAGALLVTPGAGDLTGVTIGVRTSSAGGGGRFGLFYTAVPHGRAATGPVWLYGLRQDGENRTNLALVNTGERGSAPETFRIDVYDGETGRLAASVPDIEVGARSFRQINSLLFVHAPGVRQAYARVVPLTGSNPFVAYAVVNDGAGPGERTGDGAFVSSVPE